MQDDFRFPIYKYIYIIHIFDFFGTCLWPTQANIHSIHVLTREFYGIMKPSLELGHGSSTWTTSVRKCSCRCCSTVASDEELWACHDNRSCLTAGFIMLIYRLVSSVMFIPWWCHSVSTTMSHQHSAFKASSFKCATYQRSHTKQCLHFGQLVL